MAELYFMRHAQRIDHVAASASNPPLVDDYEPYDPSLSQMGRTQMEQCADSLLLASGAFDPEPTGASTSTNSATQTRRKDIYIHFSPYLRCCQSADLLVTFLKDRIAKTHPSYNVRFHLLCDFALSEWVHEKMKQKPPFHDSADAYAMYNPNVKRLANKNACSNFRPTTMLGLWNPPDISYLEYQANCKTYFTKLMATYNKPHYIKNKDIVVVVAHGYTVANFLLYFLNHPVFEELPEAKINYARRVSLPEYVDVTAKVDVEGNVEMTEVIECDPSEYTWELVSDSLDIIANDPSRNCVLNLDTDIVYYQTNFLKRDQITPEMLSSASATSTPPNNACNEEPRISFKVESKYPPAYNAICPAARNWTPQQDSKYKIRNEFRKKHMHSEFFKSFYNIQNHPSKPVTPDISPLSEPSRHNSVVNLKKLASNTEIYKPLKLKYNNTSSISIDHLNSKVNSQSNSQTNLTNNGNNGSNNGSFFDLRKVNVLLSDTEMAKSISQSPSGSFLHMKARIPQSYTLNSSERLEELLSGLLENPQQMLNRSRSMLGSPKPNSGLSSFRRKAGEPTFIETDNLSSEDSDSAPTRPFTLAFGQKNVSSSSESVVLPRANKQHHEAPQFQTHFTLHRPGSSRPRHHELQDSDGDGDGDGEETQYIWFGQNAA